MDNEQPSVGAYLIRRTLPLGSSIYFFCLLTGIGMVFWREYGFAINKIPRPIVYRLLIASRPVETVTEPLASPGAEPTTVMRPALPSALMMAKQRP